MDLGIAVDLAGGGLEELGLEPLGQPKHVDRAMHAGLGGLHRVVLVVDRRGWAGQVVDLVHFHVQREGHIMAHQLEVRILEQMQNVVLGAGEEVVQTEHVVAVGKQALAQMRAEKAGATGDEDAFSEGVIHIQAAPFDAEASTR